MKVLISVSNYKEKVGFKVSKDFQPNTLAIRKRELPFEGEYQITLGDEESGKSLTLEKEELKKLGTLINDLLNGTL